MKYRVLITGGRKYNDVIYATKILDELLELRGQKNLIIIEGGAQGADYIAKNWAERNGVWFCHCPAYWEIDGKRVAGPIRNAEMLKEFKPDMVIAFTGNNGTNNMVSVARGKKIEVVDLREKKVP